VLDHYPTKPNIQVFCRIYLFETSCGRCIKQCLYAFSVVMGGEPKLVCKNEPTWLNQSIFIAISDILIIYLHEIFDVLLSKWQALWVLSDESWILYLDLLLL